MKLLNGTFLFIFGFLIAFQSAGLAQNTNPFEIKSRLNNRNLNKDIDSSFQTDAAQTSVIMNNDSIDFNAGNPFDIDRNKIDSINEENSVKKGVVSYRLPIDKVALKKTFTGNSSVFLLWVFMFVLIIVAILVSLNREMVIKIIKSSWFNNLMNMLHRNFGNKDVLLYSLLYISFAVNLAIFIYLFVRNKYEFDGILLFTYILLTVIFIYSIKHFAIVFFESVFTSTKGIRIYNFSIMIFNIILGIALIPVNAFAAYSSPVVVGVFIDIGMFLVVIFYVFRLFRGFLSTYNYFVVSIFHFFIYLCNFEILPLLILYKLVINL